MKFSSSDLTSLHWRKVRAGTTDTKTGMSKTLTHGAGWKMTRLLREAVFCEGGEGISVVLILLRFVPLVLFPSTVSLQKRLDVNPPPECFVFFPQPIK